MKTTILKSIALSVTLLSGAFLIMFAVSKTDEKQKEESVEVATDNQNYYSITRDVLDNDSVKTSQEKSMDNVLGLKRVLHEKQSKGLELAKELDKEAEEKRLAEIARVEAEKKAKEEAERKKQEELDKEREIRRAERQVAQAEGSDVVSRGSGYQSSYEITNYTAFCPTGCTGVTASGHQVSDTIYYQGYRIVAAPPHIAFYTKLRITYADGTSLDAIVLDRGGDIQGKRLDLLVSSRDEAYRLGRQQVKVEILSKP